MSVNKYTEYFILLCKRHLKKVLEFNIYFKVYRWQHFRRNLIGVLQFSEYLAHYIVEGIINYIFTISKKYQQVIFWMLSMTCHLHDNNLYIGSNLILITFFNIVSCIANTFLWLKIVGEISTIVDTQYGWNTIPYVHCLFLWHNSVWCFNAT